MTENVIDEAVEFIKTFEGLRLQAYSDDGGTWTIGYGSTGDHIHAGLVWSLAYAEADLRRRVDAAHTQLLTISPSMRAESIGRQVALTDFVFNEGIEWADKVREALPRNTKWIKFGLLEDESHGIEIME